MGAIFQGRTTVSGVETAPGIPLDSSPLSGIFNDTNRVGVSINSFKHLSIGPATAIFSSIDVGDVLTVKYSAPGGVAILGDVTINTQKVATIFDVGNLYGPVVMFFNAGSVLIADSRDVIVELTGVLTANGLFTVRQAGMAVVAFQKFIFNNNTTGAFNLVVANDIGPATIILPRGVSVWYWNGTLGTFTYVVDGGFDTANVTPLPAAGSTINVLHHTGVSPSWVSLEVVCLTAEKGYAIGDVVNVVAQATAGLVLSPLSFYKDVTLVGFTLIAANQVAIMNATTGAYEIPTAANWAYRFGIDR